MAQALKLEQKLLMPKASAVWLIENTILTFGQIARFTGLTEIEIEALANEEIGRGLVGRNPVENSELTDAEIKRCEADAAADLKLSKRDLPPVKTRAKGPRYTPVSKRGDKPDAIAYILKNASDIPDSVICKLVGTTKPTIESVRERTHPNQPNIKPRHPAELGLCTYAEFEAAHNKALKAAGKDPEAIKAQKLAEMESANQSNEDEGSQGSGNSAFDFSNFLGSGSYSGKSSRNEDDDNSGF
ncbi:MAG: DUF1013 domain-containing protein [Alphaproteobacteria bacterium]|nr:DUF1013 domain-containing protein [Alphaproteobacteria bacterium]